LNVKSVIFYQYFVIFPREWLWISNRSHLSNCDDEWSSRCRYTIISQNHTRAVIFSHDSGTCCYAHCIAL